MVDGLSIAEIRELFPDYEISREIEEGNIKRVFEATYEGEPVCFKLVSAEEGSRLREYALREVEIMETIESPILVELFDHFETEVDGSAVLVMVEEFIEGDTLDQEITDGGACVDLGIEVTRTLMRVLPYFAEENIVHRDIKPENIMISDDGVRLIDVGVARMNERETLTPDFRRHAPGTIAYSPQEMLRNEKDLQDVRSDIFSSGIVMFESIAGVHPFDFRDEGLSFEDAIREAERRDLYDYVEDEYLGNELDRVYKQMTEYEPRDRHRKPSFVLDDLEEIMGSA